MKVLLVSNMYPDEKHPSYGIFVKRFSDELDKLGIKYSKSVMFQSDGKAEKVIRYIGFYIKTFINILFGTYDVVYVHQASHSSMPVLAASRFRKLTIYINVHGCDVVPENSCQEKMQKYTRRILKKSNRVITPSKYFRNYMINKYGVRKENIYVYPSGGIDKNVFYEVDSCKKQMLKCKYKIDNGLTTFGMAGRISADKGWDTFTEAIAKLKKDGIKANFVIVGTGTESEKLNKLIEGMNLRNDIIRIGLLPQAELSEFYNVIDYLVFPTRREGESLGLVAIEAMACGTPVIASDFAAPQNYIKNGVNGYKFEMGNSEELAEILKIVLADIDDAHYKRYVEEAKITANEYTSENIVTYLKKVFDMA